MKRRLSTERKKRSWVWDYFEESKENPGTNLDSSTKLAKCTILNCQSPFVKVKNHNTSNMAYHLSHTYGITRKIEENSEDSEHPQDAVVEFSTARPDRFKIVC
jgi:hypothetical protein